ncbi:uncharacterized protein LOC113383762 isoform X2 [Ctenocephalides felis]|uniref:uncharacterized protein LOC113383762 isoform X2 n=1 Tax=Ctenocephalides felis TaxID=7515 RepID=UPI000E6E4DB2|nr:uncharacterized protein LOC113383762 isoform X2 [Ctenocephalides felis]
MADIKTNVERENLQNQKHVHESQQVYAPNPRKQSHGKLNSNAGEESEMYDISPYATFSVSGPESRSVTASTLDYTVQFKTFGMIEVEDGPDRVMNSQCGTPGKCGRHQMYPDDDSTLSKSMMLALGATTPHRSRNSQSQSGQTRFCKGHGSNSGKYKESESDTSGSPSREPYRVPVKPPRVFRQGSNTESNNETSPVLARRTPRHSKSSSTITDNPRFYERKKHQDLCTIYV